MAALARFAKTFRALRPVPAARAEERFLPPADGGLYVVGGDSGWLRRESIRRIAAHHLGERPDPHRLRRFNGQAATGGQLRNAAETLSFGGAPVLVIHDGLRVAQPPAGATDLAGLLPNLIARPPGRLTLVVEWEKSPNRSLKSWKGAPTPKPTKTRRKKSPAAPAPGLEAAIRSRVAAGTGLVLDADPPAERAMPAWIRKAAGDRGVALPERGAELLAERFGRDLRRQVNEIGKLEAYRDESRAAPTLAEIEAVIGGGTVRNRFRFTDAVRDGRTSDALAALDRLLEEGESPLALLALVYQLALQLQVVGDAVRRGESPASAPGAPAWMAGRLAGAARRFPAAEHRRILGEIATIDLRLKTGGLAARDALAALALRLTAPAGNPRTADPRRSQLPVLPGD